MGGHAPDNKRGVNRGMYKPGSPGREVKLVYKQVRLEKVQGFKSTQMANKGKTWPVGSGPYENILAKKK